MAFQVRASRRDDGGYDLSYGKGGKKLSVLLRFGGIPQNWWIEHAFFAGDRFKTKREAVAAWGEWAAANYGSGGNAPATVEPVITGEPADLAASPETMHAAAHSPHSDDDDLTDRERALFATLSTARGRLSEYQYAQCRITLRDLVRFGKRYYGEKWTDSDASKPSACGSGTCRTPSSGPPAYTAKAKAATGDDSAGSDVPESAVSGDTRPDADGNATQRAIDGI